LDVATAPTIILERPAPCADVRKAEELLRRALAPALAPRESWSVIARFSRKGGGLSVEGEITDEVDTTVAHRVLTEPGAECSSLARAVGVWATLVLDAEVERAAHSPPLGAPPPRTPSPVPTSPRSPSPPSPETTQEASDTARAGDRVPPDASLMLVHPLGERTLELGAGAFLMGGAGSGVLSGPALFGVFEVGRGWFLRPGLFVGRTLEGTGSAPVGPMGTDIAVNATLVAARFDACGRIAGFYIERHGIQLDVCGGGELGFQLFDSLAGEVGTSTASRSSLAPLAFLAFGPSVSFRGELGNGLAVTLRGVLNFNVFYKEDDGGAISQSPFVGRGELGLSWQLR
jgi:hypothetical protein